MLLSFQHKQPCEKIKKYLVFRNHQLSQHNGILKLNFFARPSEKKKKKRFLCDKIVKKNYNLNMCFTYFFHQPTLFSFAQSIDTQLFSDSVIYWLVTRCEFFFHYIYFRQHCKSNVVVAILYFFLCNFTTRTFFSENKEFIRNSKPSCCRKVFVDSPLE